MDAQAVVIIVVAITVGAIIKGVTGSGLPQIAIPVMSIFLGVERSVVVMVIPGLLANGWLMWRYRYHFRDARDLSWLLGLGVVGAVAGTWLLRELEPHLLSGVLAVLILTYVALRLTRPELSMPATVSRILSPAVGLAAGTLQGATGMSGPVLTTWLHSYRLQPQVYVVSIVTLFQVFTVTQLVMVTYLGLLTVDRALEGMLAVIPMLAALPFGAWLGRRMAAKSFDKVILVLLVLTSLELARSAIAG